MASLARSPRQQRRYALDRLARVVVSAGGIGVILSILALLGFIGFEVYPLWQLPGASVAAAIRPDQAGIGLLAARFSDDPQLLTALTRDGQAVLIAATNGARLAQVSLPADPDGQSAVAVVARPKPDQLYWITGAGYLHAARLQVRPGSDTTPASLDLVARGLWKIDQLATPTLLAVRSPNEERLSAIVAGTSGTPQLLALMQQRSLFGAGKVEQVSAALPLESGSATAVAIGDNALIAYLGTSDGYIDRWNLGDPAQPRRMERTDVTGDRSLAVTAIEPLIGSRALVVGDGRGEISGWSALADAAAPSGSRLTRLHRFEPLAAGITAIVASPRDKRFAVAGQDGSVAIYHSTTEQTRLKVSAGDLPIIALAFAPKANGIVLLQDSGAVQSWSVDDPHPEITTQALLGKVWYEGYPEPAYVWQSTGGTDEFEPKFSLVPLIVGTMKGTLYSLLFAAPIAILAALFTSQFCHPSLHAWIKPTVEIMAALPSVVLGFLAGLWLAPLLEHRIPGILAMLVVPPALIFGAGALWNRAPRAVRQRLWWPGAELLMIVPLLLLSCYLCLQLSPQIESWLFAGDFRHWLIGHGGRIDQRNCIVVGFALGFAVIPVIFTISEDALSNVPQRLVSASLALGATRWQTALRVVLPTASAGIFSAVMVGFGRAVGETMIVLMATGNTPILDWSIFTGMRTLSANIAVEIPEAPFGSTLYRVLFLAALMLFLTTFVLNTAAELVRQRLRRRYQSL